MAFPDYPTLQADTRSLYETDILAQQEALRQKIQSEAALKEAAYQNPERTLSQALTQAFVAGIPSLVGALAGGQRGAGYGMQAGGEGAEKLGLHYDTEDKENKQLAQNEFANAIRDRQTQENQIELLKQRRNEALLGLTGKQIEEEGEETRSKRSHEETIRYHNLIDQERKDANTALAAKEEEKKNQLNAYTVEKIRNGTDNIDRLPDNIGIKPGVAPRDKDIIEVREAVDAIDKGNAYHKVIDQIVDQFGGMNVESLPQNPYFLAMLNRARGLYMQFDPKNPLYKQGLTETERGQVYSQMGPVAVDLDFKNLGAIFATAKKTKADTAEDVNRRQGLLSQYIERRKMFHLPDTTDEKEIARRTSDRARAKQAYIDQQRKDYMAIQRGGGTYGESSAEEDRIPTATERAQAIMEALGVK